MIEHENPHNSKKSSIVDQKPIVLEQYVFSSYSVSFTVDYLISELSSNDLYQFVSLNKNKNNKQRTRHLPKPYLHLLFSLNLLWFSCLINLKHKLQHLIHNISWMHHHFWMISNTPMVSIDAQLYIVYRYQYTTQHNGLVDPTCKMNVQVEWKKLFHHFFGDHFALFQLTRMSYIQQNHIFLIFSSFS